MIQMQNRLIKSQLLHIQNDTEYGWRPKNNLPEILFITSYPPRECGIATYSQDLIAVLNNKFNSSFKINYCPLESDSENHFYSQDLKYKLNTSNANEYIDLAMEINKNSDISIVVIQHEFGFFKNMEQHFNKLLAMLIKPVVVVFHTVLPAPDENLKRNVQSISLLVESIIVMTQHSANILIKDYGISPEKITVIPHGTHLVPHLDKKFLKNKYNLTGKKVLSTFGLLSAGKSIETTLEALPAIVEINKDVMFLIIGKTHPSVINQEGERYRTMLENKVVSLNLQSNVKFINYFLPLPELLEYLQLTDIYLFTSKDPNQAVSGTFSYAISSGCPIISTPIPHSIEVLGKDAGIIFDFENSEQLSAAVINLLDNEKMLKSIKCNGLQKIASTAWENSAISHAILFENISNNTIDLIYDRPEINFNHIKKLTTDFGIIQFSVINEPDIHSGYTLDDNARALIAYCQHYELTMDPTDIKYINLYYGFIKYCQQSEGHFLNYVDEQKLFTEQNNSTNLADSNGRAIWALGYLLSLKALLPENLFKDAELTLQKALPSMHSIHSTRAMAFIIKGLYYRNTTNKSIFELNLIKVFANRLVEMYKHEAEPEWEWFESYLTYANSILPEALLCAYLAIGNPIYKEIAKSTFDFLLSKTFDKNYVKAISNKSWLQKGEDPFQASKGGEQPIDVSYTIIALGKFSKEFRNEDYTSKMIKAFNWFLGKNHLNQIVYNPCTGGCYDGLEQCNVNLNQGAESTVSYIMAQLMIQKYMKTRDTVFGPITNSVFTANNQLYTEIVELDQKWE